MHDPPMELQVAAATDTELARAADALDLTSAGIRFALTERASLPRPVLERIWARLHLFSADQLAGLLAHNQALDAADLARFVRARRTLGPTLLRAVLAHPAGDTTTLLAAVTAYGGGPRTLTGARRVAATGPRGIEVLRALARGWHGDVDGLLDAAALLAERVRAAGPDTGTSPVRR